MGNKLSISIITPTFNRADELDFLLRSISKQTYPLKTLSLLFLMMVPMTILKKLSMNGRRSHYLT